MLYLNRGRLRGPCFDQISNLDPAVGIKNSRQPFFLFIFFPGPTDCGKNTGDLRKNADWVNGVYIGDDVRVCLFVFEEERA